MPKEIKLTNGFIAHVDDEDYKKVSAFKWHSSKTGGGLIYARRTIVFPRKNGKQPSKQEYLHRAVLNNFDKSIRIDFKDNNPLNCQKNNLIISNYACIKHYASAKKGVLLKGVRKRYNKFQARIFDGVKEVSIGSFKTEEEAFQAYIEKNLQLQRERGAIFNKQAKPNI